MKAKELRTIGKFVLLQDEEGKFCGVITEKIASKYRVNFRDEEYWEYKQSKQSNKAYNEALELRHSLVLPTGERLEKRLKSDPIAYKVIYLLRTVKGVSLIYNLELKSGLVLNNVEKKIWDSYSGELTYKLGF